MAHTLSLASEQKAQRTVERRYVSLDQTLARPRLRSMAPAVELTRRPSRPPDYAAENRALIALAQELAHHFAETRGHGTGLVPCALSWAQPLGGG